MAVRMSALDVLNYTRRQLRPESVVNVFLVTDYFMKANTLKTFSALCEYNDK